MGTHDHDEYDDEIEATERDACDWLARRLRGTRSPWDGPAVVIIRARRLVVAFDPSDPVEVTAPTGMRFRLGIMPHEFPAIRLDHEPDRGTEPVREIVRVPTSLGHEDA